MTNELDAYAVRVRLETIYLVLGKQQITFSKTVSAKIVGGKYRLIKLILRGEIRMTKPSATQNGRWQCNAADVLRHAKFV